MIWTMGYEAFACDTMVVFIAREDVPWDRLGKLRADMVRISGMSYVPELPQVETVRVKMDEIMSGDTSDADKAITMLLYLMRVQLFLDGNKRVVTMACNKMLIAGGHGIFSLSPELKEEFVEKLLAYYESGEMDELKQYVYDNCLTGL